MRRVLQRQVCCVLVQLIATRSPGHEGGNRNLEPSWEAIVQSPSGTQSMSFENQFHRGTCRICPGRR